MRGTSWVAVILVILVGSVVGIAGGTYMAVWSGKLNAIGGGGLIDTFRGPFADKGRYVRIMMLGEDDTSKRNSNGNGLSDTLVVMAIDTETKDIRAISIPRDTRVEIPGHGTCKINSAHVYGGPALTKQVVESLLAVPIDYYIKTNTTGLRGMVDLLGGVYIVVDKDMHYTDRHGGLYINLKASPEKQLLNGKQAEGFVRFRHDAFGDSGYTMKDGKKVATGRIVRQQLFMRALANRVLSLPTKRERIDFLAKCYEKKFIVSDLRARDWDGLSEFFKDVKPETMAMTVLPGAPGNIGGGSYWIPDTEKVLQVVTTHLLFQGNPNEEPPKIEVLNGSGVTGAARKVADQLKEAGFDVARTANAPETDYEQSMIITHKGKSEPVQRIAKLLNCNDIREAAEAGPSDAPDVTIIVGRSNTQ